MQREQWVPYESPWDWMDKKGGDVTAGIVSKTRRVARSTAFSQSLEQLLISLQINIRTSRLDSFAHGEREHSRKERTAGSLNWIWKWKENAENKEREYDDSSASRNDGRFCWR